VLLPVVVMVRDLRGWDRVSQIEGRGWMFFLVGRGRRLRRGRRGARERRARGNKKHLCG